LEIVINLRYEITMSNKIKHKKVGSTDIQVFEDCYGKWKTTVTRIDNLESNQLYWGYDKDTAVEIYNECLNRFDIDKVDSLDEIQWSE